MGYYMGDYYRGDPGIGSFFGGLIKKVAGVATSFIPGVGPAVSGAIEKIGGSKVIGQVAGKAASSIIKHPVLSAAGAAGAGVAMMGAGAAAERMAMGGGAHHGRVLKHCGQVLKSGKIGKCHRRMNPFNPRAARRAGRRIHSLIRHYRKYVGFVSAHKPKGRPYFKSRKRK
jgi:hypothetical protein